MLVQIFTRLPKYIFLAYAAEQEPADEHQLKYNLRDLTAVMVIEPTSLSSYQAPTDFGIGLTLSQVYEAWFKSKP